MNNRNWKTVPIPDRMGTLVKDSRGYPVPTIIAYDNTGRPRFQINDDRKVEACLAQQKCAICNQKLEMGDIWLVGGPLSAFHSHGAYIDTPTHKVCLDYALQVCPYLAHAKYTNRIDLTNIDPADLGMTLFLDPTQDDDRVPFFVAINISGMSIVRRGEHGRYLHPKRPYRAMEFWNDGGQLTPLQARDLYVPWLASRPNNPMTFNPFDNLNQYLI